MYHEPRPGLSFFSGNPRITVAAAISPLANELGYFPIALFIALIASPFQPTMSHPVSECVVDHAQMQLDLLDFFLHSVKLE